MVSALFFRRAIRVFQSVLDGRKLLVLPGAVGWKNIELHSVGFQRDRLVTAAFFRALQARDLRANDSQGVMPRLVEPVPVSQVRRHGNWLRAQIPDATENRARKTCITKTPAVENTIRRGEVQRDDVQFGPRRGKGSPVLLLTWA